MYLVRTTKGLVHLSLAHWRLYTAHYEIRWEKSPIHTGCLHYTSHFPSSYYLASINCSLSLTEQIVYSRIVATVQPAPSSSSQQSGKVRLKMPLAERGKLKDTSTYKSWQVKMFAVGGRCWDAKSMPRTPDTMIKKTQMQDMNCRGFITEKTSDLWSMYLCHETFHLEVRSVQYWINFSFHGLTCHPEYYRDGQSEMHT